MTRAAVIGLGLIGGSIAARLRECGHTVHGFDTGHGATEKAHDLGLIDAGTRSVEKAVAEAEIVVLAVPVLAILEFIRDADEVIPPTALLLDVGSVKGPIVTAMSRMRHPERAVGGHPLAGAELSGPEAADAGLLRGRPFVLCPSSRTDALSRSRAHALVTELGGVPLTMTPEHHDQVISRTSHLPQLLSTALALCLESDDSDLAGPGLRDMTRLSTSQPAMWLQIASANRSNIALSMRRFSRQWEDLTRLVEAEDSVALADAMEGGARAGTDVRRDAPV